MSRRKKRDRKHPSKPNDSRIASLTLLGATIHLVEKDGHFDLLGVNPSGGVTKLHASSGNSKFECRTLMHNAVDMLCVTLEGAAAFFDKLLADNDVSGTSESARSAKRSTFGPFDGQTFPTSSFSRHENN